MIEFAAVVVLGDTGVGGYVNNALDLVFNALGAVTAMAILAITGIGRARRTGLLPTRESGL